MSTRNMLLVMDYNCAKYLGSILTLWSSHSPVLYQSIPGNFPKRAPIDIIVKYDDRRAFLQSSIFDGDPERDAFLELLPRPLVSQSFVQLKRLSTLSDIIELIFLCGIVLRMFKWIYQIEAKDNTNPTTYFTILSSVVMVGLFVGIVFHIKSNI